MGGAAIAISLGYILTLHISGFHPGPAAAGTGTGPPGGKKRCAGGSGPDGGHPIPKAEARRGGGCL